MRVPKTVTITVENEEYKISKAVFDCFREIHPKRTEDAFAHFISAEFLNNNVKATSDKIEKAIVDEYNFHLHLGETIKKAREIYEHTVHDEN